MQPYGTLRVNRLAMLALMAMLLTGASVTADAPGFIAEGRISANDQEVDEGYFNFGQEITVVVKPRSTVHDDMRGLVGKDVCMAVLPGPCPE